MPLDNPFPYSDTNHRYHTYDYYLKHTFGGKCITLPLDGGFSCPNRENGGRGCTFCSEKGSGEFTAVGSIRTQMDTEYRRLSEKWGKGLPCIAYFQSFSATYAPLSYLVSVYEEAISYPNTVALHIATRPDCLPDETVSYLSRLNARIPVTVELGLQSARDTTLLSLNRGHTVRCFTKAYETLKKEALSVCVHIINGLPGETEDDMLFTARCLADLRPDFLKIHMLHILRGTALSEIYEKEPFPMLSQAQYTEIVCRQLTLLPPETVICRLTGDGEQGALLAPSWTKNKRSVLNGIDRYLAAHKLMQGTAYDGKERIF